jgi:hypothetical protein
MCHKKPIPLLLRDAPTPRLCPVCGAASYSREGIHPQCAEQRADAPRMEHVRAARKIAARKAKPANPLSISYWNKRCPRCQAVLHVRKTTCACGYQFGKKLQHPALALAPMAKD